MNVLELFSGIGGMHLALEESGVPGEVLASIDINEWANKVYKHNFPDTKLFNQNIEGLTAANINKLNVNTILMSPPCQPFTRNGLQKDIEDTRTNPFLTILNMLPELQIERILIENVKGFEKSQMREILVNKLKENHFTFQEFMLSPNQLGIPNTRHRYYCLAKKKPNTFIFETGDLRYEFPNSTNNAEVFSIDDILENDIKFDDYRISETTLAKRVQILDICYKDTRRSCCFTKAYGRFLEGTGSVFSNQCKKKLAQIMHNFNECNDDEEKINICKELQIRFFTPNEIARLMSFPEKFSFPGDLSTRQKYMLLGNSVNVKVVAELIKLLI